MHPGAIGILVHSFSPETGRLHSDVGKTRAANIRLESAVVFDLESVAYWPFMIHVIGHFLARVRA